MLRADARPIIIMMVVVRIQQVDKFVTLVIIFSLKGKKGGVDKDQNAATRKFINEFREKMGTIWRSGV